MSINSHVSYQVGKVQATQVSPQAAVPAAPENGLTRFIPTETITLYVAALAALGAFKTAGIDLSAGFVYVAGIVLSVVWFAAQYYLKEKEIKHWRFYWGLISTPIAFAVWATAVPGNPILNVASASVQNPTSAQVAGGTVAAVLALIISSALSMVERVLTTYFDSRQQAPPSPPPGA